MNNSIKKIKDFFDGDDLDLDTEFIKSDNDDIFIKNMQGKGPSVYTSSRNEIKIGKLVKKISGDNYKDSDIEKYVNLVKSSLDNNRQEFFLLSGSDIKWGYDSDNYLRHKGSIGSSCMNDRTNYLELYSKNEKVCQLLVLKEKGHIVGRALLWKLNTIVKEGIDKKKLNIEYYLDRIYTTEDYLIPKIQKYAEKNGWAYKTENNYTNKSKITFNKEVYDVEMTVKVKSGTYNHYPYMDTFSRLNIYEGILYNDADAYTRGPGHVLNSIGGGYSYKFYINKTRIQKFVDFFRRD